MICKKTFGHFEKNVAEALKEINRCRLVQYNADQLIKSKVSYIEDLIDDHHKDIYNDLPDKPEGVDT